MPFVQCGDTALAHPAVVDAELPSIDRVPVCQMGVLHPKFDDCDTSATVVAAVAHSGSNETTCAPLTYVLCDDHIRSLDRIFRRYAAVRCDGCGASIRRRSQLIMWRRRL